MPYIKPERKEHYLDFYNSLDSYQLLHPGELNFLLTRVCQHYLKSWAQDGQPTYREYNDVIGALEACKLELYRRMVTPYEDKKIEENGDVY